jgi:integrase/recombinase XerC
MPISETYPIQDFLNYLTFQKRYSKHTVLSYQNDLTAFFDYLFLEYQLTEVKEITTPIVRSWLASLKENKASSRTINRKISSLKSFFKYQLRIKAIDVSPVATISTLKVNRRLPSFIDQKEISDILQKDSEARTFDEKTKHLLIEILYQTGIRRAELINLKDGHVDKYSHTIKVLGKGNKERLIPVNRQLLDLIDAYISERNTEFPGVETGSLLINKKGKPLDPKYVYNVVRGHLKNVASTRSKGPHILRHSFATHLTNNGAQINAVKELLGHSSLAATQIYTHNTIEKLKEVYKSAHPKS